MVHLVVTKDSELKHLPVFYSVSAHVGQRGAANKPEDVSFVQGYFVFMSRHTQRIDAKLAWSAVKVTGAMDDATHQAILVFQKRLYDIRWAPWPDGRISPAPSARYGRYWYTIGALSVAVRKYAQTTWPRIDKLNVAGAQKLFDDIVVRELTGVKNEASE
ncbi:MAG: hypothetical protein AAFX00_13205 [Pseudomonadota bacterium]